MADLKGHKAHNSSLTDAPTFSDPENAGMPSPTFSFELHGGPDGWPQTAAALSPPDTENGRPFQSPMRQHRRTPSVHREVKETLNARSEYTSDGVDGRSHLEINQYVIREEIGRGSYGSVHLATDQFGNEYAVKESSKSRLRRRAQSVIIRRPGRALPRANFGAPDNPDARFTKQEAAEAKDALYFIREEIAIMKKLHHPNLVQLIEVLDDPEDDSLYMVLEMCKKGVIMKVGLGEPAEPYDEETCRCWFRDLILGVEYLHAQGVVHRDIKPDNLLLTEDDVLKIVDFGVSEMFEKSTDMRTAKAAGSPAFLPPELCMAKHGDVSGPAADIWSMGVSLYCLRYGRIPFERANLLEMYEAIKTEAPQHPVGANEQFVDLVGRLMEKDPQKRITMVQLREHPWVTKDGQDALLSAEENCSEPIELPNALEVNHAFTRRMTHLLCVMKAISKFKNLLALKGRPPSPHAAILKIEDYGDAIPHASPTPADNRPASPGDDNAERAAQLLQERERHLKSTKGSMSLDGAMERTGPLLGIGTGGNDDFADASRPAGIVSDSPTAVDFDVYDRAFEAEVDRIKRSTSRKGRNGGTLYPTRHLGKNDSTWAAGFRGQLAEQDLTKPMDVGLAENDGGVSKE